MSSAINRVFVILSVLLVIVISVEVFNLFSLRSQKNKASNNSTSFPNTYNCPVPKDYCRQGRIIKVEGQIMGIGFQLPKNTPIYPVFKGSIRTGGTVYLKKLGGERFPTLTIVDEVNQREVVYTFTGKDYLSTDKIAGETILQAREGQIANFGVNLLINAYKIEGKERQQIPLTVKDFNNL